MWTEHHHWQLTGHQHHYWNHLTIHHQKRTSCVVGQLRTKCLAHSTKRKRRFNCRQIRSSTSTQEPPPLDSVVCYGVLQGDTYPLKLLKLTIDFLQQNTLFEELFVLEPSPFYPVYIDIILNYLYHSLSL